MPAIVLLESGGQVYGPAAVVAAAALRGELAPLVEALERRVAAVQRLDNRTLQGALTAFRKARGLTAADDFKGWMASRQLRLDDVADHLERSLATPGEGRADAGRALYAELVCTGTLDRWMVDLGRRLALLVEQPDAPPADLGLEPPLSLDAATWDRLQQAEAAYREREAALLSEDRLRRLLETRKLDMVRLEIEVVQAEDVDVARELLLCLRVDGEPLEAAAARAGARPQRASAFAKDLPRELQRELLAAIPGEVLGPFPAGPAHQVVRVVAKTLPTLGSEAVRASLAAELRASAFGDSLRRHVSWPAWRPRG